MSSEGAARAVSSSLEYCRVASEVDEVNITRRMVMRSEPTLFTSAMLLLRRPKAAIERAQCQTRLSIVEREQARPKGNDTLRSTADLTSLTFLPLDKLQTSLVCTRLLGKLTINI